jgi:anti-sigma factor (TIGR02949 family)
VNTEDRSLDCAACRERLHAYLDGELEEAEVEILHRHLEDCADCFERSQLEEAFRRTIRSVAGPVPPPPAGLEARVREALDREDARRADEATGRRPRRREAWHRLRAWSAGLLAAAALLLVAVATWSALDLPTLRPGSADGGVLHPAFLQGELVCLDCLMAKRAVPSSGLDAQLPEPTIPAEDPAEHHRLRFRAEDGRLWDLFPEAEAAPPLEAHENAGRRASLVGTAYSELGVVRVARLTLH